jgi:hypothetical protein
MIKAPPGTRVIPYGFQGSTLSLNPTNSPLSPDLPQPISKVEIAINELLHKNLVIFIIFKSVNLFIIY